MNMLENATPAQTEAIEHQDGPLMILAGAGSGKTLAITARIARLIAQGVRPCNILAITFTNKAADEMKERVEALVGKTDAWIATFHSMCARILRAHADRIGFTKDFTIYDADDSRACVKSVMEEMNLSLSTLSPRGCSEIISTAKRKMIPPEQFAASAYGPIEKAAAKIYAKYETLLHSTNCMDFDDLLLMAYKLLREHPDILQKYADRFKYISVDEFQDTNTLQYMLARLLACKHKNICVVGDPDQTIYTWRGATLKNVFDFERDFPGAKVVLLEQNFRSTKKILLAASELISHNEERKEKRLVTDNPEGDDIILLETGDELEEAANIVQLVGEFREAGFALHDIAVLYRVNAQSRPIEEALLEEEIPYALVGAVEFYRRKEIKDILAYLRLVVNPADAVSFARVVNIPPRGIGAVAIGKIADVAGREGISMMDVAAGKSKSPAFPPRQAQALKEFADVIEKIRAVQGKPVAETVMEAVRLSGYQRNLEGNKDERTEDRVENIDQLINAAAEQDRREPQGGLQGFLEYVALVSDTDQWDEKADRVTLMTLHSSKGQEFPVVIVSGLEEGLLPHILTMESPDEVEEERRLCFVGMTRAKKRLAMTYANRRATAGRYHGRLPSRFLSEIPSDLFSVRRPLTRRPAGGRMSGGAAGRKDDRDDEFADETKEAKGFPESISSDILFKPGERVRHEHFGVGGILSVQRRGKLTHARILFDEVGERTVVLEYANLQRIEDW
jgi:DNA helicase-2/ATP-dependent DNA helicase PcrA